MKKRILVISCICTAIIAVACIVVLIILNFNTPLRNYMTEYYNRDDVYIELSGTIKTLKYYEDTDTCHIDMEITTENHDFNVAPHNGLTCFEIPNYSEYGYDLCVNDEINFISAAMLFYNGNYYPILSVEKNGEIQLDLEDGKKLYLKWIETEFN